MTGTFNKILNSLKQELALYLSLSFGIFLFVLFFQPFSFDTFDFNNRLLFVAGLGGIVFLFVFLIRIVLQNFFRNKDRPNHEFLIPNFINGFILTVFISVAFAFYIRYVGGVKISFYIMSKVVLISFSVPVILRIYDRLRNLNLLNETLLIEKEILEKQVDKFKDENLSKIIEFVSETAAENLKLLVADVVFIKSADNYVEVVYREEDKLKKKLVRATMKNVEVQIKPYQNFIRCHRTSIVNIYYVEKLNKSDNGYTISMEGYQEQIPVSRQYLVRLREAL